MIILRIYQHKADRRSPL